jgi:hypothetical protein
MFKARTSVSLGDLFAAYMGSVNEQKKRAQQQQFGGGQPQQQQDGDGGGQQLRAITLPQLQMAVLQLADLVNVRGGVLTKKAAGGEGGGGGGEAAAPPAGVEVA